MGSPPIYLLTSSKLCISDWAQGRHPAGLGGAQPIMQRVGKAILFSYVCTWAQDERPADLHMC
jgi:hypothetical protein